MNDLSRRDFLKGVLAGAVAAALPAPLERTLAPQIPRIAVDVAALDPARSYTLSFWWKPATSGDWQQEVISFLGSEAWEAVGYDGKQASLVTKRVERELAAGTRDLNLFGVQLEESDAGIKSRGERAA